MESMTSVMEIVQVARAAVSSLSVDGGTAKAELLDTLQDELSMTIEMWSKSAAEAVVLEEYPDA